MTPRISIVMSVRDGMPYLPEAVASILGQTFGDFEFLIMDNASKDGSAEWVETLDDPRIRLVRNGADLGLSGSLNRGFDLACGEYIARMDADDISPPDRLATQLAFMETHPDVAVCGGDALTFSGNSYRPWPFPHGNDNVLATLCFGVPLAHSSACYRASVLREHGLRYDESLFLTQDWEMWRVMLLEKGLRIDNPAACVLHYRTQGQNLSEKRQDISTRESRQILERIVRDIICPDATEDELVAHALCVADAPCSAGELEACYCWLFGKVLNTRRIAPESLRRMVANVWDRRIGTAGFLPLCRFMLHFPGMPEKQNTGRMLLQMAVALAKKPAKAARALYAFAADRLWK